jgi:hypothetical protein
MSCLVVQVDLDASFAAVEQRDYLQWLELPRGVNAETNLQEHALPTGYGLLVDCLTERRV